MNVALAEITRHKPAKDHGMVGLDASKSAAAKEKASLISGKCGSKLHFASQAQQLGNADSRVLFTDLRNVQSLREYTDFASGLQTCDYPKFIHCFWEADSVSHRYRYFQSTVKTTQLYGGLKQVMLWGNEGEAITDDQPGAVMRGAAAWGNPGVAISAMSEVKASLYSGCPYDDNTVVIVPKDASALPVIWACCSSPGDNDAVRKIDRALKVRRALIEVFVNAGVLRKNPPNQMENNRGKEPERPKDQYPWFWGWDEETEDFMGGAAFDGNRWNDLHYSNQIKRTARERNL